MHITIKHSALLVFIVAFHGLSDAVFEWTGETSAEIDASNDDGCDFFLVLMATGSAGFADIDYAIISTSNDAGFEITKTQLDSYLSCDIATIRENALTSYTVTVRFSTSKPESANQELTITVINFPMLTFTTPSDSSNFTLPEDVARETVVTMLSASYGSTTSGFTFSLVIQSTLFEVSEDKLKTATNANFDLEAVGAQNQYWIQLRVSDGSSYADISVSVTIQDLIDNAPQFIGDSDIKIEEHAMDTMIVSIDPTTGVMTLRHDASSNNMATLAGYALEVTATDGGSAALSTSKVLTVTLGDVDSGLSSIHSLGVAVCLFSILLKQFAL